MDADNRLWPAGFGDFSTTPENLEPKKQGKKRLLGKSIDNPPSAPGETKKGKVDEKAEKVALGITKKQDRTLPSQAISAKKRERLEKEDSSMLDRAFRKTAKASSDLTEEPTISSLERTKRASEEVVHALNSLSNLPLSAETMPLIFNLECKFRNLLTHPNFPQRQKIERIFNSNMLPLLEEAKSYIREHPKQYAVQAAAAKGKAALLGANAILSAKANKRDLKANVESAQEVILLPEDNTVLKRMGAKAKEESYLADSLFDLMSQQAVVGTFDMKTENYEAKPFVQMTLVGDLLENTPAALDTILQSLTPDAEFNAILTGEIQLLDLHANNLAVAPKLDKECEKFVKFRLPPHFDSSISLKDFIIKYLGGEIDPRQPIQYVEKAMRHGKETQVLVQKTLAELPSALKRALTCSWQFVIFDTDMSLAEDNRLQSLIEEEEVIHLIPLRSCLLETKWKDIPLSDETVHRLINSDDCDKRVQAWTTRRDAPIYQQLSPQARSHLDTLIRPRLEAFSLSAIRLSEGDENITIKDLRDRFVQSLCEDGDDAKLNRDNRALWRFLAQELHYDFESRSEGAIQGRYVVARQLFPRLTIRQQEALFERQANRKEYLQNYMALSKSKSVGQNLLAEMEQFINQKVSPLSSLRKKELLAAMKNKEVQLLTGISDPVALKDALLKETRPTYFNLMKAMYPLLADVYELTVAALGSEKAGWNIGFFGCSLESIIETIKTEHKHDLRLVRLALALEDQITSLKNPSFFGYMAPSSSSGEE